MTPLRYSKERVHAILSEIARLKDLDFPYDDSRDALDVLEQRLRSRSELLGTLTDENDAGVLQAVCSETLLEAFRHLPLLGFILRSTDVRNSFEIFGPLLRLAKVVLGDNIKLILSSEWQLSPHVIHKIPEIPHFVLLGLPASESENPLLTPLAGHEFGHSVWHQRSLSQTFSPILEKQIHTEVKRRAKEYSSVFEGSPTNDLFVVKNVSPAHQAALMQVEETFCDCLGLRLFYESYYHAFTYLLFPGVKVQRSPHYPQTKRRVANLVRAAARFQIELPQEYDGWFVDESAPSDAKSAFLLSLADDAAQHAFDAILNQIVSIAQETPIPSRCEEGIKDAIDAFNIMIPAAKVGDLANILNAGWKAYLDTSLWEELMHVDKREALRELLLKSIEILEIEQRTE